MAGSTQNLASLPHILIVDDDNRIRDLVSRFLMENGFVVMTAGNADEAEEAIGQFVFDGLVVDVMMPGRTGLEFVQDLRKQNDIPVLLLTALGETEDRIAGLEIGADDYLPKPFEPRELVLRLNSILKRRSSNTTGSVEKFKVGNWVYDPDHNELLSDAETVRLTTVEGNLLRALASRGGEVISRDDLAAICGLDAGERTIDVQVTRLRRKIEDDPKAPRYLQTVRGKGYLLRIDSL